MDLLWIESKEPGGNGSWILASSFFRNTASSVSIGGISKSSFAGGSSSVSAEASCWPGPPLPAPDVEAAGPSDTMGSKAAARALPL